MSIRGLIFDFDGTLANSLGDALSSFNSAFTRMGETPRTAEEIKRYFGTGADRIFTRLLGDQEAGLRAFELYKEHQRQNVHRVALHDGVLELLDRLAREQVPISIVTGRHSDDLEILLSHHRLTARFTAIVCDNHVRNSKPDPEGIHLALRQMKLLPADVAYVGDSVGDMQAAIAAGTVAIAALWDPLAHRESMSQCGPHYLAEKPEEIWAIKRSRSE